MKIRTIGIKGFRGYSSQIEVKVSDLLVLVGKNDIGKSTVLEALDVFFNDGKGSAKARQGRHKQGKSRCG
jgi:predicted ATP-dependent endonuclease of OLD family